MKVQLNIEAVTNRAKELGLSQANIAETLQVSREAVSQWFKNEKFPRPDKLLKLVRTLNLGFDEMVISTFTVNDPVVTFHRKGERKVTRSKQPVSLPVPVSELASRITSIIETARNRIQSVVDHEMVHAYWKIGREIVEDEQNAEKRAGYGKSLLKNLTTVLTLQYGKGFDYSNLKNMRQFYMTYPIGDALRSQLSWTHYRLLMRIDDPNKRSFYEIECANGLWSTREMERQMNSLLYERELEKALLEHLQKFLLELGKGFSFVARQKRITLDGDHFFIDLIFYNYILKCFVLIDLKIGKLAHQDLGQMQMYVNYYTREMMNDGDIPPIGILLCDSNSDAVVRFTLPEGNNQICASRYKLYLPTEDELRVELMKDRKLFEQHRESDRP